MQISTLLHFQETLNFANFPMQSNVPEHLNHSNWSNISGAGIDKGPLSNKCKICILFNPRMSTIVIVRLVNMANSTQQQNLMNLKWDFKR